MINLHTSSRVHATTQNPIVAINACTTTNLPVLMTQNPTDVYAEISIDFCMGHDTVIHTYTRLDIIVELLACK